MPDYKAPLRDMQFVLFELLNVESGYQQQGYGDADRSLLDAVLTEAARFTENVVAPLNRIGDVEGCQLQDDQVTTPTGFKEAYQQFVESGWPGLSQPVEYGGQGLPSSVNMVVSEMLSAANHSFNMYPSLAHGARSTLMAHGSEQQKKLYMPNLVSGSWTGTMCLTESHCGSDVSLLRTKAIPNSDGSYRLNGTKFFISAGDHDLAENIIHIVIARIDGAPAGNKGISLFIVPKYKVNEDGSLGERNAVNCGALEHKMGIHGNATCVLNFDGAEGYLIGPENKGLSCMFTFMNSARLNVGLEGTAAADAAYQGSQHYARERLQMRSITGPKNPDGPADPIIVHPDVRRMLLTQRAFAESGRAMIYEVALLVDVIESPAATAQEKASAERRVSLLTPIAKAFATETGLEATNLGMQVFGGHGYIAEWGMEQLVRDTRISCIYEGTTGIQALDLLARKVLGSQGALVEEYISDIEVFCSEIEGDEVLSPYVSSLKKTLQEWQQLTQSIAERARENGEVIGAASVDYLMYSGYVVSAYCWLRMAAIANTQLLAVSDEKDFYQAKMHTAHFYFERVLPRTHSLAATINADIESLMSMPEHLFNI